MADETKKYLVNIESNLSKYAKEAVEAKKKVDELTNTNKALKESGTATTKEIEKSNADLRIAQKEYSNAKKSIDLVTQANKAQSGSYEQLYRQWQLAQTQLKLMGGAYEVNEKGVRVLSQRYIEQSKVVADAKKSLDAFGKGVHDNRLNVGNYSEALEGAIGKFSALPGPIGRAASAVSGFAASMGKLLLNPILLALTGITLAVTALGKAFLSTAEGAAVLKDTTAGLKAQLDVFRERAISLIDALKALFSGDMEKAAIKYAQAIDLGSEAMKGAYEEAKRLSEIQRQLNKDLAFHVSEEAEEIKNIQEYLFLAKDKTKTDNERLDYLKNALRLTKEHSEMEAAFAQRQYEIDIATAVRKTKQSGVDAEIVKTWIELETDRQREALKGSEQLQDFYNRLGGSAAVKTLEESYAKVVTAQTELFQSGKRAMGQMTALVNEITDDNLKYWEDRWKNAEEGIEREKKKETELKEAREEAQEKYLQDQKKMYDDGAKMLDQTLKRWKDEKNKEWESSVDLGRALFELNRKNAQATWDAKKEDEKQELDDLALHEKRKQDLISAGIQGARSGADAIFEARRNRLQAQMTAELSVTNLTEQQKVAINKKYAKLQQKTDITQAIINGALAVTNALATTKPFIPAGLIAGALAAVTAAAQVAVIKSQSFEGGSGGSATVISGSAPAQRNYATQVGATIFTQPQLSQTQINALPNQNTLSAEDIAIAISKLPAPIVTVEDINAKTAEVKKVEVMATI